MKEKEALSEELLDGWLEMSLAVSNERLVSAMTYNESMVCKLLCRRENSGHSPYTATELCVRLQILKPQMNVILNRLEEEGLIERLRSVSDKRNVHIRMTEKGVRFYEEAHREILQLPEGVIERLGEEKMRMLAQLMHETAGCFREMMQEKEQGNGTGGKI